MTFYIMLQVSEMNKLENHTLYRKKEYILFFWLWLKNIDGGDSLEMTHLDGPIKYPQSMFLNQNKKNNIYL